MILVFLTVLVGSTSTSPLNHSNIGIDSSIFMAIGKGIAHGKIPYKDMFDHKGPFIFYINAIGFYFFNSVFGVFVVQVIFMTINLFFVYKISRLLVSVKQTFLTLFVFIFGFIGTVEMGNRVEEYSLPFLIIPIYFSLKFLSENLQKSCLTTHPIKYSLIYGICFSINILTRLNNSAILCGIILAFTIILIKNKAFKELFLNAGAVLLGVLLLLIPTIAYFYSCDALYDFIYASYLFNFITAFNGAEKTFIVILTFVINLSSFIMLMV